MPLQWDSSTAIGKHYAYEVAIQDRDALARDGLTAAHIYPTRGDINKQQLAPSPLSFLACGGSSLRSPRGTSQVKQKTG